MASVGVIRFTNENFFDEIEIEMKKFSHIPEVSLLIQQISQIKSQSKLPTAKDVQTMTLCCLLTFTFLDNNELLQDVLQCVREKICGLPFELKEKSLPGTATKRSIYRHWRSLVVHTLNFNYDLTSVEETDVIFKGELKDELENVVRACSFPSQKVVDELALVWSNDGKLPLDFLLMSSNKKKRTSSTKKIKIQSEDSNVNDANTTEMNESNEVVEVEEDVTVLDDVWSEDQVSYYSM